MAHGSIPTQVQKYEISKRSKVFSFIAIIIGLAAFFIGLKMNTQRAWQSYLTSYFYFVGLVMGGLFFTAIQHVSNVGWSVTIRRIPEAFASAIPYAVLGAAIFLFAGSGHLYEWLHNDVVAADPILQGKAAYLNAGAFLFRVVLFFGLWSYFAYKIVGNSLAQDKDGNQSHTIKNVTFSVVFLLIYALSYSLFSVDFMMSLDPHWFSTIFGIYCFSGSFQSSLAMMIVIAYYLLKKGHFKGWVNENHMHDLGKFLFAFTVFYAYIAFSQFMLIWYANLPEETGYYIIRGENGWMWVSMSLLIFKFVVPFLAIVSRYSKRNLTHLRNVAVLILVMQYVDNYWLVYPNFNEGKPQFGFVEVGVFIGFLGIFWFAVTKFLSTNSLIPIKDPRLDESLHHHI